MRRHSGQPRRLVLHPSCEASGAQIKRSEHIVHRLGDPVLGDQLLDVEIDRRRPDALAVLGRRGDAGGKLSLGLQTASRTAIDQGLVLGDLDQPLGQIEHLPLLHPHSHRSGQAGAAVTTQVRRMPLDSIGGLDLFERVALVPGLPAARLARASPKAARNARLLLQPVARRRLRTVQVQSSSKLGRLGAEGAVVSPQRLVLAPQVGDLALQRFDRLANLGRKNHPHLDSWFHPTRLAQ